MTAYTDKSLPEIIDGMELLHKLLYIRKPFAREEIQQITLSLAVKWNVEQALVDSRRRLKESHRRLEAVLDATEDGIAMYEDARLVFANRSYDRLFDIPPRELHELSRDAAMTRFKEALPPSLPAARCRLRPAEGTKAWSSASAHPPLRDKPGCFTGRGGRYGKATDTSSGISSSSGTHPEPSRSTG